MSSKKNDEDIQYQPIKEGTFLEVDPKRGVGGGGKVEILREKNTSRYASRSKAPYILHFIDFHVNNPHNSDLYVFLTHDKNGASKKMKRVDNRDTIVYLENGNGGRVRGPGARGTFSQELNGVTDILALTGIAVVKQANGRPVTPDPQVHIYAKLNDIGDRSPAIWYPVLHLRRTAMEDTFYERKKLLDEEREKLNAGDFASQKEDSLKLMEKHAKKIFKKYDADGSGEVDLGEFLVMLRKLKLFMLPSRARKIFEYCDMERDGNLDYDQFQISLHVIQELDKHDKQSGRDGSQPLLQLLPHEAFDMMDADNDGKLDKLEFNEALRALNVVPTFSNQLDGESYLKRLWLKVLQKDLPPGEPIPMYAKIRHFEHAFLELCDVEAELKARGIRVPKNTIFGSIKHSASDNSLLNIASANTKETDEEKARRKSKWLETARKALHDHIAAEEKKERAIMQAARSQGWERKRQERIKVERVKQAQKHQAQKEANAVRLSQAEKEKSDRAAEKARRMQGAKAAKLLKTMKHEMKKLQQKRQEQETKERREEMQRRLNDDENAVIRNGWDRMDFSGQRLLEVPKEAYWYKERKEKGQEAKRLSSVRILNFSNNHLTNLPEKGFFFHLDELQKIDVSWNQITHFPAEMKECKKVQILNASNNHLTHIEESSPLSAYKHLVRLELSSNRIEIFHKHVMRNLVNLKSLEVANNALEIVPHEIRYLTNLKSLDFHGNFLHTLGKEGGFASLTAMHTLNLSNNKLESLPDDFGDLSALVDLNLGHNKLRWL
jgi:Ca2+-binding EF-hand superfamily protein